MEEIRKKINEVLSEIEVSDDIKKWIDEDLNTFNHNYLITAKKSYGHSYNIYIHFAFKSRVFSMLICNAKNTKIKNEISYRQGVIRTYLNAVITAFGEEYVNTKFVIRKIIMKLMEYER